jgi:large subunit ribosomal protein L15
MKLHDLRPADGSRKARIRVGRGIAAGKGKTAGRGTKGQKARAGGPIPPWFEGGPPPLHMRTAKLRGFKNRFKIEYEVVNVGAIGALADRGAFEVEKPAKGGKAGPVTINQDILRAVGLVRTLNKPLKILGAGELSVALFVVADAFTKSATAKIEAAGGSVNVLEIPTTPLAAIGVDGEAEEARTARVPRTAAGRAAVDKEAGARAAREADTAEIAAEAAAEAAKPAKSTKAAKAQAVAGPAEDSDAPGVDGETEAIESAPAIEASDAADGDEPADSGEAGPATGDDA